MATHPRLAALAIFGAALVRGHAAPVERFIVKDRTTTVRLLMLDGDRLEERHYDPTGAAASRVVDLATAYPDDAPPPVQSTVPDGTRTEETPLGRARCTYRHGAAVLRQFLDQRQPKREQVEEIARSLLGRPLVRPPVTVEGAIAGRELAYAFYDRLGVFLPWSLQDQSIFGQPLKGGPLAPGDLMFFSAQVRGAPEVVGIAIGESELAIPDARSGKVAAMSVTTVPGHLVAARRILGTPWQSYLVHAPAGLLARLDGPGAGKAPRWNRIQGLASFYDHRNQHVRNLAGAIDPEVGARIVSGDPQDAGHKFTIAHRSLPFGTRVKVTLLETGRSIVGEVTDRGQFENERSFEVCFEAAKEIGLDNIGVGVVEVEVLPPGR